MKFNRLLCLTIIISSFALLFPNSSMATEEKDNSNMGYTVSAVPNSKQLDLEKTYFYLKTDPGKEEELKVKIKSTQKEPVKVNVYVADAFTGEGGTIEYTREIEQLDETLKAPITTMTKVETSTITVENYEEKEAVIKLTAPKDSYPGIKMGVLVFELDSVEKEETVGNKFAYRIGLFTSETGDDYKDSDVLNLLDAKSTLRRGKKMVLATLQNPEPKILMNLKLNVEVRKKGSSEIIKQKKVENYTLAPNSHFDFELDWGTSAIQAGTYTLTINANNEYNQWKFEKNFVITGEQAKQMNEDSAFKIITPTGVKVSTILGYIALVVLILILSMRRKKLELDWRKRKKRRKGKKKKEGN